MGSVVLENVFATRVTMELTAVFVYAHTTATVTLVHVMMGSAFVTRDGVVPTARLGSVSVGA